MGVAVIMSQRNTRSTRICGTLVTVPLLISVALSAHAQQKTPDPIEADAAGTRLEEIIVTGSRIARPDLERLQPTTVISARTLDDRGYTDVGEALNELPGFGVPPASAANTQSSFGIAQSFVDLYSLGSQRTLTLVNGRRFVSSNTPSLNGPTNPGQQVDLNVIPTKLIERIETISVGGAPIYGADAISGTVNIILKKDFSGLDLDAQVGTSSRSDASSARARALWGQNFAGDRGNVTVVGEYSKASGLYGTERSNYASDLGFQAPLTPGKYDTVLTPANAVTSINFSGIPLVDDLFYAPAFGLDPAVVGVTRGGTALAFQPLSSALQPYNLGKQTGNPIFWEGGDGLRLGQVSNLLSPLDRLNLDTVANFKISENTNLFAEGWFSQTHSTNLIAQPAYNTALFGSAGTTNGSFIVKISNPFLSDIDRALIQKSVNDYAALVGPGGFADPNWSADQFYLTRASVDLQSGRATASQVLARGVIGIEGKFALGKRSFNWEIAANYGSSRNVSSVPSYVTQNLFNAINAVRDPLTGNIVCGGTPANAATTTLSSVCAPINLFGQGSPSRAALDYITHIAKATSKLTQRDLTATVNGGLFNLPAGEVKMALGVENRRESASFVPDEFYTLNLGQAAVTGIAGDYHTNEVFTELLVPVISPAEKIPLVHSFQLEGAARRVSNSIAGVSTTWTGGLRWSPIEDLQFRANRTSSIRAPAITELFLPTATSFQFANDPCDKNFVDTGNAPATRAANCAAAGIDTTSFVSNVVNATAQGSTSGNTHLQSETADSRTVGIVLRPRWVPRLSLTLDYIDIRLSEAIETLTLQDLMEACYDSTDYPNNPACSAFTRNSAAQVTNFTAGYINAGLRQFTGLQGGFDYPFDLPRSLGQLDWRMNYLNVRKEVRKVGAAAENDLRGQLAGSGSPSSRGSIDLNWHKGAYFWNWQGLYVGPMVFDNHDTATSKDIRGVGAWWVVNSTLGYEMRHGLKLRLIVDNVFEKEPPYPALAGTQGNFANATSLYFSGIIGRTYLFSVDKHF